MEISNLKSFFMSKKLISAFLLPAVIVFCSCGSGKKLESSQAQVATLQSENGQLTTQVNDLKKQNADLTAKNKTATDQYNTVNTQYASYKKECEASQAELKEVQATLDEFRDNLAKLMEKLQQAEAEFADKGLEVYSKDGVVFVDMQDKLLYKSGSATVGADGKKALENLASVLNEFPKLKVIVVGNTDTVKVKGAKDNWSLSTERANSVVRILSGEYNIDPTRLPAAGKGKYYPKADNSTAEGRAKNRRIEIVLNPDWERIWEAVKEEGKTQ